MEFFSSEKLVKWFALMVSILFHICLCNITFISLEERMMLVILFFWTFISVWIYEVGNRGAKSQVAIILTSREISNMPLTTDHAWPAWWISFRWNCRSVGKGNTLSIEYWKVIAYWKLLKVTSGSLVCCVKGCLNQYVTGTEFWKNILVKSSKYFIVGNLGALHPKNQSSTVMIVLFNYSTKKCG